jgi:hypothetical protein
MVRSMTKTRGPVDQDSVTVPTARALHVPVLTATRSQQQSLQSSVAGFPQVSILLVRTMIHPRSSKLAMRVRFPSPAPAPSTRQNGDPSRSWEGPLSCVAAARRDRLRAATLRTALIKVSAADGLRPLIEVKRSSDRLQRWFDVGVEVEDVVWVVFGFDPGQPLITWSVRTRPAPGQTRPQH